jgi:hypothetical protein
MSVDVDGSEGMGIDVDVDESKQNTVFGDECKKGTGMGDDTDILLKVWAPTMKLLWSINKYLEILTADEGSKLIEDVITLTLCNSGSSSIPNCSERESKTTSGTSDRSIIR